MNKLNKKLMVFSLGIFSILALGLVIEPTKAEARRNSSYVMPYFGNGWGEINMQPDPYYHGRRRNINNYGGGYVNSWSGGGGYVTSFHRNSGYWR